MVKNGQTYYLVTDQVGTVRAVCDTSGSIVKEITYDSFGNILTDSAPTFTIPLGFAGGLHDRDTNLVHFGFRDYDPDSGAWTAKDPVLFASGDIYLYEYCSGNPVQLSDPLGLWQVTVDGGWGIVGRATVYSSDNQVGVAIGVGVGAGVNFSFDSHTSDNPAAADSWTFDAGSYATAQAVVVGADGTGIVSAGPGGWSTTGTGAVTAGPGIVGRGEVEGSFSGSWSNGKIKHGFDPGIHPGVSIGAVGAVGYQVGVTISRGTVQTLLDASFGRLPQSPYVFWYHP